MRAARICRAPKVVSRSPPRLGAESRVSQGAEAELWFDSTHLQLFDAESGRSLLAADGAASAGPVPAPAGTPSSS